MNTAEEIHELFEKINQGLIPIVRISPIRGEDFDEFIIFKMDLTPPPTICGWRKNNSADKLKIYLSDTENIQVDQYFKISEIQEPLGNYRLFEPLKIDL